ncbi:MAG: VOC family protein [Isosphaeraceae bacterium]
MRWNPYLTFDGRCEEAFRFYEKCLGGTITVLSRFGETPVGEHLPPDQRDRIMHARLVAGDQMLMGSDSHAGRPYEGIKGCSMALQVDSAEEAERVFHALSENGAVLMPLQQTFWAERFGMLTDRFGVPWLVNYEAAR